MKVGITYRLFLSILAATCVALLCLFLIMHWSINRGFLKYIAEMEEGKLNQLAKGLEEAYGKHGSWNFLRDDPIFWLPKLLEARHNDRFKEFDKSETVQPFHSHSSAEKRRRQPLIVLDAEMKTLFGSPAKEFDIKFVPIIYNNTTVGYAGLLPPKEFLHPKQREFLSQQKTALIVSAFSIVLIVVIVSLPIAKHLTRPIRLLTQATRELASGNYTISVPVTSSDELGQLTRDFNSLAITLENYEKARRQWVADISHELRTPLSVLRGEIEALLEGIRTVTPEAIRSLNAEVIRLNRLVEDLYQLALSDLGTLNYNKDELLLSDVLMNAIELYSEEFNRQGINTTINLSKGEKLFVFADRERLHQLFVNILDNSLKYTEPEGALAISLLRQDDWAVIDFEDSAPGVLGDELDKLFDRLYRVEGSRSRMTGGAGLGLAICKTIVEAHEGIISAHPSSLGGVLIKIMLPIWKVSS